MKACDRSVSRRLGGALGVVLVAASALRAEHARIDFRLRSEPTEVTAVADEEPPAGGRNAPPVLNVQVNKPLVLQFFLTNTYPHKVLEHVQVRYYVVRVARIGRKAGPLLHESTTDRDTPPPSEPAIITMGRFTMDFKPDCRVGARVKFQIPEPGLYTARVETLNTQSDHEHFSAIDLVVK